MLGYLIAGTILKSVKSAGFPSLIVLKFSKIHLVRITLLLLSQSQKMKSGKDWRHFYSTAIKKSCLAGVTKRNTE